MTTVYYCEVCNSGSQNPKEIERCEGICKLVLMLDAIFTGGDWKPPLPLYRFNEWSIADRKELANLIHYNIVEQLVAGIERSMRDRLDEMITRSSSDPIGEMSADAARAALEKVNNWFTRDVISRSKHPEAG